MLEFNISFSFQKLLKKNKKSDTIMEMIFNKENKMKRERNTDQKEILIKYLKNNANKHLSISQIQKDLSNEIGLTTIYRIINTLVQKGSINKIPLENSQGFCYQYNNEKEHCSNHFHLICEKCNKTIHVENSNIKKILAEMENENQFKINNNRIVFYGLCDKCMEKENA